MKPAVWRLVIVAVLFVGWLGYLGWQVLTRPVANGTPLVVSRPQILASVLDVIADVPDKTGEITVVEVLYPPDAPVKAGDTLHVAGITECEPLRRSEKQPRPPQDWSGPGRYLLPLRPIPGEKGRYEVSPIPPSPGFLPGNPFTPMPARIYPATPAARAQYRQIAKPEEDS